LILKKVGLTRRVYNYGWLNWALLRLVKRWLIWASVNLGPVKRGFTVIGLLFKYLFSSLLALSKAARDFNLVKPKIVQGKQIHIKKGRHILQELCVNMFVPNDTHSSEADGFIKILNGPNASGKSVYLKQVTHPEQVDHLLILIAIEFC
jgi:hypothetical protein